MSVRTLKNYSYLEWLTIANKNNALREAKFLTPWTNEEIWQTWRDFFGEAG